MSECVFCDIMADKAPATIVWGGIDALVIVPLNPVVPGHVIAIPRLHATDFADKWMATHDAMYAAHCYVQLHPGDWNLITSKGVAATQSVFHLHVHIVPRRENDGLALPWYSGKSRKQVANG